MAIGIELPVPAIEPRTESTADNTALVIRISSAEIETAPIHDPLADKGCCVSLGIYTSAYIFTIVMLVMTFLPFGMIFAGIAFLYDCPISNFIPIYLLGLGICSLLYQVIFIYNYSCQLENKIKIYAGRVFGSLIFIWFVVGSVFVYIIYKPNGNPLDGVYCAPELYYFAFWSVNVMYALGGLFILACACIYLAGSCSKC